MTATADKSSLTPKQKETARIAKVDAFRDFYAKFDLYGIHFTEIEELFSFDYRRHPEGSMAQKTGEAVFTLAVFYIKHLEPGRYRAMAMTNLWASKNPAVASLFPEGE